MTLSKEIQEAIQKNMPNMVAGELQEYIVKAENNKKELDAAVKMIEELNVARGLQVTENRRLKELELSEEKNKADREALKEEKRDLRVQLAESKAENATVVATNIKELVQSLFRNAEFRKNVYGSGTVPSKDQYGITTYHSNSSSKNVTEEQI